MLPILVVTCPSGKIAAHLLPLLSSNKNYTLRLAAHTTNSHTTLSNLYPGAEIHPNTDLNSLPTCQSLLRNATAVIHIGPSLHSREKEIGLNMVDAAVFESQRPGNVFKHFIFSSVLNTQHRQLMQHDLKSYIEERLMVSPLNWTILKPTNFMDAYPVKLLSEMERPVIERLWTPEVENSVIALRDIADAIEKVVVEGERHYLAEYPLSGTMPVSDKAIIENIGRIIGKEIEIKRPTFEGGVERLVQFLFGKGKAGAGDFESCAEGDLRGDICRDGAERLVLFYTRRGLKGSPNVLRWLLGREPTSVEEWIRLQLEEGAVGRSAANTAS